jgi:glycosyltransferase involved in cell wall biosynthesis/SAM-dependent methyltransferase
MLHRQEGCRLLRGRGIEIGALHAATPLSPALHVEYCDAMDEETARQRFPELAGAALAKPDHLVDVDLAGLAPFARHSLDFVIANMVLAHLGNPLRLLEEMVRVVKPGGHIVVSAADKRFTHDRDRPSTSFDALLQAHAEGRSSPEDQLYVDLLEVLDVGQLRGPARRVAQALERVRERREAVHVWDSTDFRAFLERAFQHFGVAATCVYERVGDETGVEDFSVWRIGPAVSMTGDQNCAASGPGATGPGPGAGHPPIEPAAGSVVPSGAAASPARKEPRTAPGVLLLGMHRSGTSLATRLLGDAGLWLGSEDDFLPAHPQDNPDGYWERRDVYEAQAGFLRALGRDWDRLAGYPGDAFDTVAAHDLRAALQAIVGRLQPHSPWLVKDPRLGLVLPAWRDAGADFVPVVVIRHPLEIAGSLARSPRGVYPTAYLLALWEKYLRRTLAGLDGQPAVFLAYRRLMADPAAELARVVGALTAAGLRGLAVPDPGKLAERIKPGLYRQRSEGDPDGLMTAAQQRLWAQVEDAARQPGMQVVQPDDPEPDGILALFQDAFDQRIAIGRHLATDDNVRAIAAINAATAEMREMVQQRLDNERRNNEALRERIRALEDGEHDLRERLGADLETRARLQQELEQAQLGLQAADARCEQAHRSVQDMQRSLSWRITAPLRWVAGKLRLPRMSWRFEQRLYRMYYGFPGISYRRKRQLILWLHRRLPFLTRSTQSYTLFNQGASRPSDIPPVPRMDAARAAEVLKTLARQPVFSIIMPVYNTDPRWLHDAIESLRNQYYGKWELCIVDDCSNKPETLEYLAQLDDPRIRQQRMESNAGIARTTNAALALATGEYIGLLDHDDVLTRDALLENVLVLQDPQVDLIYSDEDKMDVDGGCHGPVYKPDYSPDYLFSNNYFCHFTVVARKLVDEVGGLHYGYDGAQDFDLVLRLTERARKVHHIPKVLYHWRMVPSSTAATAGAKPYTWEAGRRALTDALTRRAIAGRVDLGPYPNTYHVRRDILGKPRVSIVVPFRDEPALLRQCVGSILERSTWQDFELVLVDNQSRLPETAALLVELQQRDARVRALRYDRPFNYSALHNWVVPQLKGDLLLLLNNDTQVISNDWIESLVEHAQRPEVGVVGCRLLYPDETVQHGGVIIGIGSFAGHAHHLIPADHPGYMAKPHLLQNVSAVTFACAMMRMSLYRELGGLDEKNLGVAYNDVDFCLRAMEKGYLNVYTPHAELYHHESKTRGSENDEAKKARFEAETGYMRRRHRALLERGDPFYNINFRSDGNSYEVDPGYTATLPV